jgi:hypothetical protein
VNKGNHLWNTLLDYHYGEMIKRFNDMDGKLDTSKDFEEVGYLLRALWRENESGLRVHDTRVKGQISEKDFEEYEKKRKNGQITNREFEVIKEKYNNPYIFKNSGIYTDLLHDTYWKTWGKPYQFTFHEFFHNIDDLISRKYQHRNRIFEYYNEKSKFGKIIIKDVEELREIISGTTRLDEINNLNNKHIKAYLYDIIGGASEPPGEYGSEGGFGHDYNYWTKECRIGNREACFEEWVEECESDNANVCLEVRLAFEVFANIAAVAVVNSEALNAIKKYLPESYEVFVDLLEDMVCDM